MSDEARVGGFLGKSLRDQRRAAIGWSIGLAAVALTYALFYPSIKTSALGIQGYIDRLPEAFKTLLGNDYTTPAGYLRGEVFSTMGPILMLVFAIGAGARAIAGEEEERSLDLLLSTPLDRRVVLRDKALALGAAILVLAAVLFGVIAVIGPAFQLHIGLADLGAGCFLLALLAAAFGAIALAVSASVGRRAPAVAVATGLAVSTLILNALSPSVIAIRPLRPLSPFRWYLDPDPLKHGLHAPNVAVLVGIAVVGYVAARGGFTRRDLAA